MTIIINKSSIDKSKYLSVDMTSDGHHFKSGITLMAASIWYYTFCFLPFTEQWPTIIVLLTAS